VRVAALLMISAAALTVGGTTGAQSNTRASLRLVSLDPVAVHGAGFASRERVRVDLSGAASERRRTFAARNGSLSVRFAGVHATRCDVIRVVAVGSRGSRTVLKYLPSPACLPA
jgi:hypothetical protein